MARMVEIRRSGGFRGQPIPLHRAMECLVRAGFRDWAEELETGEPIYLPGQGGACMWPLWTAD